MIISDAGDRERRQGYELRVEMEALGIAGENYTKVTGGWRWSIWIDSDYPQGLDQLEEEIVQFLRGAVWPARRLGKKNLCNFQKERAVGAWHPKLQNS